MSFPVVFVVVMCTAMYFIVQLFIILVKRTTDYVKQSPELQGRVKTSVLEFHFLFTLFYSLFIPILHSIQYLYLNSIQYLNLNNTGLSLLVFILYFINTHQANALEITENITDISL